jgi:RNA-directed DNA polymerase
MVVKQLNEPDLDPIFLANSYGYRPRKSAHDAIGVTRKRCWKYDWVLEFDIKDCSTTSTTNFCFGLSGGT